MEASAPTRAPAACGTTARRPGQGPARARRQAVRRVEQFRILQVGERTQRLAQRTSSSSTTPGWRTSGTAKRRCRGRGADPAADARRRDPLAQHLPPRDPGGGSERRSLRSTATTASQPVFNGKDLDGLGRPGRELRGQGRRHRLQAEEGRRPSTRRSEYADFVARLEFKLPPGGNNGLAIRYPGEGDAAYVGMCELQVLDDDAPNYAKLDPRQAHGSAYGMVAAARGYLRPVGRVELPGSDGQGLDHHRRAERHADPRRRPVQGHRVPGDKPHPGKDRTEGHFGFAGHNDPVEFRNVRIKRL